MKHERFKIFRVKTNEINSEELINFLNGIGIVPKSISVDKYYQNQKLILIGYENATSVTPHKYHLQEVVIDDVTYHGLSHIGDLIEQAAKEVGGVICQDIEYSGERICLTFLTTK